MTATTQRKDDKCGVDASSAKLTSILMRSSARSFVQTAACLPYELAVDRAWAKALEPIGIFTAAEVRLTSGCAGDKIAARVKTDAVWLERTGAEAEDVHHFVKKALVEELGPLGWKLHALDAAATNSSPRISACSSWTRQNTSAA